MRMSALDANPFLQGTGERIRSLGTLQFRRSQTVRKPMVVWIYAEWCGHCQQFLPTWRSLVRDHPDVLFVTVDGDSNTFNVDAPETYPAIRGYPTIWLFKRGSMDPVAYDGQRNEKLMNKVIRDL